MKRHLTETKLAASISIITLLGMMLLFMVICDTEALAAKTTLSRNIKIEAGSIKFFADDKVVASGPSKTTPQPALTVGDNQISAETITGYWDAAGITIEKIEAKGNVTIKGPELNLKGDLVIGYVDLKTEELERLEATGNVTFKGNRTKADGVQIFAEGECDKISYIMKDDQITLTGASSKRTQLSVLERTPIPASPDGKIPASMAEENYDFKANKIIYNLTTRYAELDGDVEFSTDALGKKTPKQVTIKD